MFRSITISGACLSSLNAHAFADAEFKEGYLIGTTQGSATDISSILSCPLLKTQLPDVLNKVGIFRCRERSDHNQKFSVNDYIAMHNCAAQLFCLVEVENTKVWVTFNTVSYKDSTICPKPIEFTIKQPAPDAVLGQGDLNDEQSINKMREACERLQQLFLAI